MLKSGGEGRGRGERGEERKEKGERRVRVEQTRPTDAPQLRVPCPKLLQDKLQLLRATESEGRDQHVAAVADSALNDAKRCRVVVLLC